MTEKRFTKDFECSTNFISFIYDNKDVLTIGEVVDLLNEFNDENEQLKQQIQDCEFAHRTDVAYHRVVEKELKEKNQQYKALLQDIGLLMSDEDVMCIRKDIAEKFIKPVCNENGFDVDVDCTNGFTIILKGDDE